MKELTHRDEVHGDVHFDPLAVALLNTPALQRLGRIYQLAYSHLVYRGGTHTRLSHVMGAYHVAGKLVDALQKNYSKQRWPEGAIPPVLFLPSASERIKDAAIDVKQWTVLRYLVSWAALLHDLGHVPLGHTLEDEFTGIYEKHDAFASPRMAHLWLEMGPALPSRIREVFDQQALYPNEFAAVFPTQISKPALIDIPATEMVDGKRVWQTVLLICLYKGSLKNPNTFRDALDEAADRFSDEKRSENRILLRFIEEVRQALTDTAGMTFFPYMADIVGNTICADYLDYLRRDPQNLGLDILWDDRVTSHFWIGRPLRLQHGTVERSTNALSAYDVHMALSLVDRRGKPRLDTTTGVVELVRQRYRFAEIVYYHKTKAAASSMLAKVFQLIEAPAEVRPEHPPISLLDVDKIVTDLLRPGRKTQPHLDRIAAEQLPTSLLDAEIGDESMHLMLQYRAWDQFKAAIARRDSDGAQKALRAFALLKALSNRELYKVTFALTRNLHKALVPGAKLENTVSDRLNELIKRLREGDDFSSGSDLQIELQRAMEDAAKFSRDSILLYIPSLKAQAKGIETGSLDRDGDVITLGEHHAVEEDVRELLRKYSHLWKFLVFVHPSLQNKAVGLSAAIDTLVVRLYSVDESKRSRFLQRHEREIREASWFEYIVPTQRAAALAFEAMHDSRAVDWTTFSRYWEQSASAAGNPEDRALYVHAAASIGTDAESWAGFKRSFPSAEHLGHRARALRDERSRAASSALAPIVALRLAVDEIVDSSRRLTTFSTLEVQPQLSLVPDEGAKSEDE